MSRLRTKIKTKYTDKELEELSRLPSKVSAQSKAKMKALSDRLVSKKAIMEKIVDISKTDPEEGIGLIVDFLGIKGSLTFTDEFFQNIIDYMPSVMGVSMGIAFFKYWDDLKDPSNSDLFRAAIAAVISAAISFIMGSYEDYFSKRYPEVNKAFKDYYKSRANVLKEVLSNLPEHPLKFVRDAISQSFDSYIKLYPVCETIFKRDKTDTYILFYWMNNIANLMTLYYSIKSFIKLTLSYGRDVTEWYDSRNGN